MVNILILVAFISLMNNGLNAMSYIDTKQSNIYKLDLCSFIRCQNGGVCFYTNNLATCQCPKTHTGFYLKPPLSFF